MFVILVWIPAQIPLREFNKKLTIKTFDNVFIYFEAGIIELIVRHVDEIDVSATQ